MTTEPTPRAHIKFCPVSPLGGGIINKNVFWLIAFDGYGLATKFNSLIILWDDPYAAIKVSEAFRPIKPVEFDSKVAKQDVSSYLGNPLTNLNQTGSHDN